MSTLEEVREALDRAIKRAGRQLDLANKEARGWNLYSSPARHALQKYDAWRALRKFSATLRRIEKKHSKRPKGET